MGLNWFLVIMRQLGHHTTGYLTWKGGINSAMVATIDRRCDNHHVTANFQVIKLSVFPTMLFHYKAVNFSIIIDIQMGFYAVIDHTFNDVIQCLFLQLPECNAY